MSKTHLRHKTEKRTSELKPIQANAAGIDIGSQTHWVSVPPDRAQECVKSFGCYTSQLYALADWLAECGTFDCSNGINRCVLDSIVSDSGDSRF